MNTYHKSGRKSGSASFVIGFMVKNNLDLSETYQIDGVYSEKNNAAVFQIKDAKVYGKNQRINEG